MIGHRLWCVAAFALVVACAPAHQPDPGVAGLEGLLPISLPDGWSTADVPVEYDPETLYEYLNGGAPLYLDYGFVGLLQTRYQLGGDSLAGITIDIFDMGSSLGAFGLYSSIRPPDATYTGWGAEGYRSGAVAAAWRGTVYVHGVADEDRAELTAVLERLLAEIMAGVAGEISPPAILAPLPVDGLVPRSERWVASDLLGHAFLPGGVLATYAIDDREGKLFFSDLGSSDAAAATVAQLRAHQERWGEIARDEPPGGAGGFRFSGAGLGSGTVFSAGQFVVGIHGDLSPGMQDRLLEELVSRLQAAP